MTAIRREPDVAAELELLPAVGQTLAASRRRYLTATTPWTARDVLRCLAVAVVGAGGLAICWYGASGEEFFQNQIGWLLGGLLSTGIFVLAAVLWLGLGARELRIGVRELTRDRTDVFGLAQHAPIAEEVAASTSAELVTASGMRRYHRTDCLFVQGKDVAVVDTLAVSDRDLAACGVCTP